MINIFGTTEQKIKKCEEELEKVKEHTERVFFKINPSGLASLIVKREKLESRLIKLKGNLK
jgi:hypothetical protein